MNKQDLTKKVEYKSVPYHSISHFSVETSEHFDLDAKLKIWNSSIERLTKTAQIIKDKLMFKKLLTAG